MRVLVGMSGGIDSSVAALLLQEAGHEVVGVTMSTWREENPFQGEFMQDACFGPNQKEDINEARRISERLGIEYHVIDCAKEYEEIVLSNFKDEYLAGRTPNPCVWCNSYIKFGALVSVARQQGLAFDAFATGHYANITFEDGRWLLHRGIDETKDQTYFLYRLTQKQLSETLFPLGHLRKKDVKQLSIEKGFFTEQKGESQDFYKGDYSDLLGSPPQRGEIITSSGEIVGEHQGYWNYTIGQRRGLGVSAENPLYVLSLDAEHNRVVVGGVEETFKEGLVASKLNWIAFDHLTEPMEVVAKIRSTQKPKVALITPIDELSIEVKFSEKQKAITPGQSAVFYKDNVVLGGGVII
jgi:tRNA-specific 2-thiouridylase